MASCTIITAGGDRCKESRIGWLWVVQEGNRLRYVCTRHLDRSNPFRVSAKAMQLFLIEGGER